MGFFTADKFFKRDIRTYKEIINSSNLYKKNQLLIIINSLSYKVSAGLCEAWTGSRQQDEFTAEGFTQISDNP